MTISIGDRGKLYISQFLKKLDNGDKVVLKANPSIQHGLFNLRFYGKIAEVIGMQGACYMVQLKDGGVFKKFIVHPTHLKRV